MKTKNILKTTGIILIGAAMLCSVRGQDNPIPGAPRQPAPQAVAQEPEPLIDLNFPGGTPAELVKAIREQAGVDVNVIIPTHAADTVLPPVDVKGVTPSQLFEALSRASSRSVSIKTLQIDPKTGSVRPVMGRSLIAFGFRPGAPNPNGKPVWSFYREGGADDVGAVFLKMCSYYQLASYLDQYSIEDISTAIRSGWKYLEDQPEAKLSFHKETGLLIVYGSDEQQAIVSQVLQELNKGIAEKRIKESAANPKTPMPSAPQSQP